MTTTDRPPSREPSLTLDHEVLSLWAELASIGAQAGHTGLLTPFVPARERLELGLFRLVVMGEIKKGKSSFINALLGEPDLLPTANDVATSTVFKVLYGPAKKYLVFFQPDVDSGKRLPPRVITSVEVSAYGTESGNPANAKRVDFIGVELPNPLLKDGLVIVDTPGVGGLFKAHRQITWAYAPNADAVIFVLDSVESVISADEVSFLKELTSKVTKRVYFVQTKTDAGGIEQSASWRERNLAILSEQLGFSRDRIVYFPVSSKQKAVADRKGLGDCQMKDESAKNLQRLTDSGFPPVRDFLRHGLMRQKKDHLAVDLAGQLLGGCRTLRADLAERLRILQAGQQTDLDRIRKEYEDTRKQFENWQRTECGQELRSFSRGLAELKQKTRHRIQDDLDPTGPIVSPILDNVRRTEFDPRKLNDQAAFVQQQCLADASEAIGRIYGEFNTGAIRLLRDTLDRLAKGFGTANLEPVSEGLGDATLHPIQVRDTLDMKFSSFESARTALYGGMAGSTLATLPFIVIGLLFPPAAAIAGIAMMMGGAFGGYKASSDARVRKREEALARLTSILQDVMRKAQKQALAQFDEMTSRLERRAEDEIQAAVEARRRELEDRLRQVDEARGQTREQHQTRTTQIKDWVAVLDRNETVIGGVLKNVPSPASAP
jgi:Dynamin family